MPGAGFLSVLAVMFAGFSANVRKVCGKCRGIFCFSLPLNVSDSLLVFGRQLWKAGLVTIRVCHCIPQEHMCLKTILQRFQRFCNEAQLAIAV
jgi:hypothetical protein